MLAALVKRMPDLAVVEVAEIDESRLVGAAISGSDDVEGDGAMGETSDSVQGASVSYGSVELESMG